MTVYSHSRLSTFENCPLQYRLKYVDKIKLDESETIEAFMGSRVHEALEKLYKDLRLSKTNTVDELLSFYDDNWKKNYSGDIRVVKEGYSPQNYRDTGAKCIREYYARYQPFNDGKTLGIEQIIHIDIEGYKLRGFIDRLSCSGGIYEIHDYKTSQYLPLQSHFDSDRQLALYQLGVQDMFADVREVDLVWHYLVFDKEIRSRRAAQELLELKNEILVLIGTIERAEEDNDFQAKETGLCDWCEYQSLCTKRMHIVKTGQMSLNKYLNDPGVKLVNQYVEKTNEKKKLMEEIDAELELLKEAIIAYAKKEGVEVIRGNDKKLRVRIEEKTHFPTKEEKGRGELDAIIKEAGKWEAVSDLNVHALAKAMNGWSPQLIEKIKEFRRMEESCRIYVSGLKERE
ncbi:MAG: PD-(D/E)XK nuclease family protein [Candidatus Methanoperedens sp.]|nr:PD-(D/E)XK nuclease family protein [Candidatus Methanoperedens sp.]